MVSSTIARRSAFVRHRFFLAGSPTCCDCVSVSTIPLRGHKHQRPHTHNPHSHSRSTHGENRTITSIARQFTEQSDANRHSDTHMSQENPLFCDHTGRVVPAANRIPTTISFGTYIVVQVRPMWTAAIYAPTIAPSFMPALISRGVKSSAVTHRLPVAASTTRHARAARCLAQKRCRSCNAALL